MEVSKPYSNPSFKKFLIVIRHCIFYPLARSNYSKNTGQEASQGASVSGVNAQAQWPFCSPDVGSG